MTILTIKFMFYVIYILNRHLNVPKDVGSWSLEYELEKRMMQ